MKKFAENIEDMPMGAGIVGLILVICLWFSRTILVILSIVALGIVYLIIRATTDDTITALKWFSATVVVIGILTGLILVAISTRRKTFQVLIRNEDGNTQSLEVSRKDFVTVNEIIRLEGKLREPKTTRPTKGRINRQIYRVRNSLSEHIRNKKFV